MLTVIASYNAGCVPGRASLLPAVIASRVEPVLERFMLHGCGAAIPNPDAPFQSIGDRSSRYFTFTVTSNTSSSSKY
jgi:hypothetical protein